MLKIYHRLTRTELKKVWLKIRKNNLMFYANFVVLGELFNHMCENYGYGLKKISRKTKQRISQ